MLCSFIIANLLVSGCDESQDSMITTVENYTMVIEQYSYSPFDEQEFFHKPINFMSLSEWSRHPYNPIFRDPLPGYEVASDGHVFHDNLGTLRMVYTGDHNGHASIKMALGDSYDSWTGLGVVLQGQDFPYGENSGKETPFYFFLPQSQTHQIYYIAYNDGNPDDAYNAEIYLAQANQIEGPYTIREKPVVSLDSIYSHRAHLITSPSVLEFEGLLYLIFLVWNAPPNQVTEVWVMGTVSDDLGETWGPVQEVEVPIGMEGQVVRGPDGLFYVVSTKEYHEAEAIFLSRGSHPFGPYNEALLTPILVQEQNNWEKDEIIAPQLIFDPSKKAAYLYYTGADYQKGYWIMVAQTEYKILD